MRRMLLRMQLKAVFVALVGVFVLGASASGGLIPMYAMHSGNVALPNDIYQINLGGTASLVNSTALSESTGIAFDGTDLYYWHPTGADGLSKWNLVATHTVIEPTQTSEANGCFDSNGKLWMLEGYHGDDLDTVDKTTGTWTKVADISGPLNLKFYMGDIAWGPDGLLYISTKNTVGMGGAPWDDHNNYIWNPAGGGNGSLTKCGGDYYPGLAWYDGKLYGGRNGASYGLVFELNPTTFAEVSQVGIMPMGVEIHDLGAWPPGTPPGPPVPEPAGLGLIGMALLALRRRRK